MRNETTSMPTSTARYYVGDLCYVMHPEWNEVCDLVTFDNENSAYELSDGRQFFMLNTAYGDGTYNDNFGRPYSVDSGTIGAIKVSDITDPEFQDAVKNGLGQIVEFPVELDETSVYADGGMLAFDTLYIDTSFDDEEDEVDPEDFEDDV
jgi:hypothetical protein